MNALLNANTVVVVCWYALRAGLWLGDRLVP